ncbi:hypothetical protein K9M79_05410 [Candidatus Woesearchaeota archaeon]|nr:hypothetical protein [Candidatus Woesearchaeota archaeon]
MVLKAVQPAVLAADDEANSESIDDNVVSSLISCWIGCQDLLVEKEVAQKTNGININNIPKNDNLFMRPLFFMKSIKLRYY